MNSIKQYLSGKDQSNTPQIREAAKIYIQACREVNSKLSECRNLIAAGLYIDAEKISDSMNPTLCSRAKMLFLEPVELTRLKEICQMYQYGTVEDIDYETLNKLDSNQDRQTVNINNLILRWRKIARTGSNIEKIRLLRDIIRNLPDNGDNALWISNLQSVEKQHTQTLLSEAESALASGNGALLEQLCNALHDPELLSPIDGEVLKKYQPCIEKHQKELLNKELQQRCTDLFAAYSAMNPDQAAIHLREYDMLVSNPLYTPDPMTEQAVAEVRTYVSNQQLRRENEQIYQRTLAELTSALDKHADYESIENLYAALRQTDLPIDQRLNSRVANRREEYIIETNRRHLRKCIYGVLSAILLLIVGFMTFILVQRARNYNSSCDSMLNLMKQKNYAGVLELYENIQKNSPVLLQFGKLSALKMEAEKLLAEQKTAQDKLAAIFDQAEKELQKALPDQQYIRQLEQNIKSSGNTAMTPALEKRLQEFQFAVRQMEFKMRQQQEKAFSAAISQATVQLDECMDIMQRPNADFQQINARISVIMENIERYAANAGNVSPQLRQQQLELVRSRVNTLRQDLRNAIQRKTLNKQLNTPKSFVEYIETLEKLPETAPDLAAGSYKTLLQKMPLYRMLNSAATMGNNVKDKQELQQFLQQNNINIPNICFASDASSLLPDEFFAERLKRQTDQLQNDLFDLYNCYELVFEDPSGVDWRFYSAEQPISDRSRTSRIPKALAVNVMLSPGSNGKFLPIRVIRKNSGEIVFYPGKLAGTILPKEFVKLKNMNVTDTLFPKARHSRMLERILRELSKCSDPEALSRVICEQLQIICKDDSANTFARAAIARRLLDILPLSSEFYLTAVNHYTGLLDTTALQQYELWYQPTVEAEFAEQSTELKKIFNSFNPENLQKMRKFNEKLCRKALDRGITAGGIILKNRDGKTRLHFFTPGMEFSELWLYTSNSDSGKTAGFTVCTPQEITSGTVKNLENGTVFFVPFDNNNTRTLADEFIQQAAKENIAPVIWPASWPLNRR